MSLKSLPFGYSLMKYKEQDHWLPPSSVYMSPTALSLILYFLFCFQSCLSVYSFMRLGHSLYCFSIMLLKSVAHFVFPIQKTEYTKKIVIHLHITFLVAPLLPSGKNYYLVIWLCFFLIMRFLQIHRLPSLILQKDAQTIPHTFHATLRLQALQMYIFHIFSPDPVRHQPLFSAAPLC